MAYTKQGFKDNDVLYASQLEAIEDAIIEVEQSSKIANTISNVDVYSNDEMMIGYWRDGKPLYRLVVIGTTASTINTYGTLTTTNSWDIDVITNIHGSVKLKQTAAGTLGWSSINNTSLWCGITGDGSLSTYPTSNTYTSCSIIVIVEYTKTTDTAINPSGFGSSDYSTDEIVIGRWIDGKPLYRRIITKKISVTASTEQSTYSIEQLESNIKVHKLFGSYNNLTLNYITTPFYSSSTTYNIIGVNTNNILFFTVKWGKNDTFDLTITIEYTKNTD